MSDTCWWSLPPPAAVWMLLWPSAVYFSSLCTPLSACSSQTDQTPTNAHRHTLQRCLHHHTCSLNPLLLLFYCVMEPVSSDPASAAGSEGQTPSCGAPCPKWRMLIPSNTQEKKSNDLCNISKYHSTHFLNICPNLHQYKTQIFTRSSVPEKSCWSSSVSMVTVSTVKT